MINVPAPEADVPAFSLLGGPLHRIGLRLGLVRAPASTVRLGLAIGFGLWSVAAVFAVARGRDLLSFAMLGAHVRLLVAIPLLFLAESVIDARMDAFMRVMVRSRVVSGEATAALRDELSRVGRWKDGWLPEAVCLALALAFHWLVPLLQLRGVDNTLREVSGQSLAPAGLWYSFVCLTVLRFLLLRWIWRLLLWWRCLWFLSRLPLRLVPAHADGAAGLGSLEMVHLHFAPLVLAISIVLSASFAVDIRAGVMTFEAVYPAAAAILLLDAAIFLAPLLLFTSRLWACKVKGVDDYMVLGEDYATGFDRKWIDARPAEEDLLGSSDIQSLADLRAAIEGVREMRIVPISPGTMINLAIVALLPLAPLVLFKIPLAKLVAQLLGRLTGV